MSLVSGKARIYLVSALQLLGLTKSSPQIVRRQFESVLRLECRVKRGIPGYWQAAPELQPAPYASSSETDCGHPDETA